MRYVRSAAHLSVCLGVGLLIASFPSASLLGLIGAIALLATGTVGVIETEAPK